MCTVYLQLSSVFLDSYHQQWRLFLCNACIFRKSFLLHLQDLTNLTFLIMVIECCCSVVIGKAASSPSLELEVRLSRRFLNLETKQEWATYMIYFSLANIWVLSSSSFSRISNDFSAMIEIDLNSTLFLMSIATLFRKFVCVCIEWILISEWIPFVYTVDIERTWYLFVQCFQTVYILVILL